MQSSTVHLVRTMAVNLILWQNGIDSSVNLIVVPPSSKARVSLFVCLLKEINLEQHKFPKTLHGLILFTQTPINTCANFPMRIAQFQKSNPTQQNHQFHYGQIHSACYLVFSFCSPLSTTTHLESTAVLPVRHYFTLIQLACVFRLGGVKQASKSWKTGPNLTCQISLKRKRIYGFVRALFFRCFQIII